MKYLYCIFLFFILSVALATISRGEQPNSRIDENLTETSVGCAISSCSFTASTDDFSPTNHHLNYNDFNNGCWTSNALCPNNIYSHNNVSSKYLKFKLHLPAGQLNHSYSDRLLAKQNSILSYNPSAIRYSYGYYIYALAHILI